MADIPSSDLYIQNQTSLLVKCCMLRTSLHGQRIKFDGGYHLFFCCNYSRNF